MWYIAHSVKLRHFRCFPQRILWSSLGYLGRQSGTEGAVGQGGRALGRFDRWFFRDFRAVFWVLGMPLGFALVTGQGEPPKLELADGSGTTESLPAEFSFRFVITVFLMPIETGGYQFTFKPFTVVGEDANLVDTGVSGEVVQQDSGKSIASVLVQSGGEPVTMKLEAGKLYRMTLASLVNGIPADKSASVKVLA